MDAVEVTVASKAHPTNAQHHIDASSRSFCLLNKYDMKSNELVRTHVVNTYRKLHCSTHVTRPYLAHYSTNYHKCVHGQRWLTRHTHPRLLWFTCHQQTTTCGTELLHLLLDEHTQPNQHPEPLPTRSFSLPSSTTNSNTLHQRTTTLTKKTHPANQFQQTTTCETERLYMFLDIHKAHVTIQNR